MFLENELCGSKDPYEWTRGLRSLSFPYIVNIESKTDKIEQGAPGVGEAVDAFFGAQTTGLTGVLDGFKVTLLADFMEAALIFSGGCQNWPQNHLRRHLCWREL